ncbi:MAG: hypothetical protein RJB34_1838 [Pseudomonadota bacterium]
MIDAHRVVELAQQQQALEHRGLRGRFRELLIDGMLEPWLPPSVACATGTVISFNNQYRSNTQEDVLLIDKSISPPVLLKPHVQEGVFLRNSVLARIEVKSSLESRHVTEFKTACKDFHKLGLDLTNEQFQSQLIQMLELNFLFSFKSSSSKKTTLSWFSDIDDGSLSAVCVADTGFWKWTNDGWQEFVCKPTPAANIENTQRHVSERVAAFASLISNTTFSQHIRAQGRNPLSTLEGGVGQYFNQWEPLPKG